jgi:hypothetical protein
VSFISPKAEEVFTDIVLPLETSTNSPAVIEDNLLFQVVFS